MKSNKEENIETITKLNTFTPLLRLLHLSGLLPPLNIYRSSWKNFLYNIFSLLTFLSFIPLILMQMTGFYIYRDNFTMITVIIFQLAAYFDGMVTMAYFLRHRKKLIKTFHLMETTFIPYMAKVGTPRIQEEILTKNKQFSKFITTVAIGAFLADMATWCVLPSVVRYSAYFRGEEELEEGKEHLEYFVLVMWLPKNATVFPRYQMLHTFQFFSVWGVVANYAAGKLIIVTLFYHLAAQFKILASAIEEIDTICANEISVSRDDQEKLNEVKQAIEGSLENKTFCRDVNSFLTNILLFDLIIFQILMCLPPLQLIFGQNASTFRFVSSIVDTGIWPLLICFWGEAVSQQSLAVQKAAYNCRWYDRSEKVKKLLLIVLMRTREPVRMTAGKFYNLSLETFADIENKVYAYFTLLKNMHG
ncbi:hypothetical protein L9F63_017858 [Diploptera punctata]|uniref:Odorant receptor n=1 Tax=Diploptera punctata TaxID=6984 RepID=A0AAD8EFP4_DIPPU|nr:hypothetical protein L9F63_017858 [Diploptera punctata]